MSDWDSYRKVDSRSEIATAAEEFMRLTQEANKIRDRMEVLSDQIASNFQEESGDQYLRVGDNMLVTCTRSERWSWDTETLEAIVAAKPDLPPHVKRTLSVDKRKFRALADDIQKELLPALTRKPGNAQIKVSEVK